MMPIDSRIRDLLTEFDDLGMPGALREAIELLAEEVAELRESISCRFCDDNQGRSDGRGCERCNQEAEAEEASSSNSSAPGATQFEATTQSQFEATAWASAPELQNPRCMTYPMMACLGRGVCSIERCVYDAERAKQRGRSIASAAEASFHRSLLAGRAAPDVRCTCGPVDNLDLDEECPTHGKHGTEAAADALDLGEIYDGRDGSLEQTDEDRKFTKGTPWADA